MLSASRVKHERRNAVHLSRVHFLADVADVYRLSVASVLIGNAARHVVNVRDDFAGIEVNNSKRSRGFSHVSSGFLRAGDSAILTRALAASFLRGGCC